MNEKRSDHSHGKRNSISEISHDQRIVNDHAHKKQSNSFNHDNIINMVSPSNIIYNVGAKSSSNNNNNINSSSKLFPYSILKTKSNRHYRNKIQAVKFHEIVVEIPKFGLTSSMDMINDNPSRSRHLSPRGRLLNSYPLNDSKQSQSDYSSDDNSDGDTRPSVHVDRVNPRSPPLIKRNKSKFSAAPQAISPSPSLTSALSSVQKRRKGAEITHNYSPIDLTFLEEAKNVAKEKKTPNTLQKLTKLFQSSSSSSNSPSKATSTSIPVSSSLYTISASTESLPRVTRNEFYKPKSKARKRKGRKEREISAHSDDELLVKERYNEIEIHTDTEHYRKLSSTLNKNNNNDQKILDKFKLDKEEGKKSALSSSNSLRSSLSHSPLAFLKATRETSSNSSSSSSSADIKLHLNNHLQPSTSSSSSMIKNINILIEKKPSNSNLHTLPLFTDPLSDNEKKEEWDGRREKNLQKFQEKFPEDRDTIRYSSPFLNQKFLLPSLSLKTVHDANLIKEREVHHPKERLLSPRSLFKSKKNASHSDLEKMAEMDSINQNPRSLGKNNSSSSITDFRSSFIMSFKLSPLLSPRYASQVASYDQQPQSNISLNKSKKQDQIEILEIGDQHPSSDPPSTVILISSSPPLSNPNLKEHNNHHHHHHHGSSSSSLGHSIISKIRSEKDVAQLQKNEENEMKSKKRKGSSPSSSSSKKLHYDTDHSSNKMKISHEPVKRNNSSAAPPSTRVLSDDEDDEDDGAKLEKEDQEKRKLLMKEFKQLKMKEDRKQLLERLDNRIPDIISPDLRLTLKNSIENHPLSLINSDIYLTTISGPPYDESPQNYLDVLSSQTISTYPYLPGIGRAGDPICDYYYIRLFKDATIISLADGCNWGEPPKQAAKRASTCFVRYVQDHLHLFKSTRKVAHFLLNAISAAHSSIIEGYPDIWSAGTTTLVGGILLPYDVPPSSSSSLIPSNSSSSSSFHSSLSQLAGGNSSSSSSSTSNNNNNNNGGISNSNSNGNLSSFQSFTSSSNPSNPSTTNNNNNNNNGVNNNNNNNNSGGNNNKRLSGAGKLSQSGPVAVGLLSPTRKVNGGVGTGKSKDKSLSKTLSSRSKLILKRKATPPPPPLLLLLLLLPLLLLSIAKEIKKRIKIILLIIIKGFLLPAFLPLLLFALTYPSLNHLLLKVMKMMAEMKMEMEKDYLEISKTWI